METLALYLEIEAALVRYYCCVLLGGSDDCDARAVRRRRVMW